MSYIIDIDATPHRTPNGLELSCPAEAGRPHLILAHNGGPGTLPHGAARRVSFSELLGAHLTHDPPDRGDLRI
jgi:hypothetical protein